MEEWEEYAFEPKEFIEAGEEVLVPHIVRARSDAVWSWRRSSPSSTPLAMAGSCGSGST
jgi:hypothetical protein